MTEKSWFWNGLVSGDASLAWYSSAELAKIWKKMFTVDPTEQGVIAGYLTSLLVDSTTTKARVDDGAAIVNGRIYENDALIEKQGFGDAGDGRRYWRNVLRCSPHTNTARVTISGPSDTAYPGLTQIEDGVWEIPLSKFETDGGEIDEHVDERRAASSPLCQFINFRQGGSSTIWAQTGSDTYLPGTPKVFVGAGMSDGVTAEFGVGYPFYTEFLYPPMILTTCYNASMTHVRMAIANIAVDGWDGYTRNGDNSIAVSTTVMWLVFGPVA